MKRVTVTLLVVAGITVAVAVVSLRDKPPPGLVVTMDTGADSPIEPQASSARIPSPTFQPGPAVNPTDPDVSAPATVEDRAASLKQRMADKLYSDPGATFLEQLVTSGLSRSDSERIVRDFSVEMAECGFAATQWEAEAQSIPFDDFLYGLEGALANADVNIFDMLDERRIQERALPCFLNASQRAGIAFPWTRRP